MARPRRGCRHRLTCEPLGVEEHDFAYDSMRRGKVGANPCDARLLMSVCLRALALIGRDPHMLRLPIMFDVMCCAVLCNAMQLRCEMHRQERAVERNGCGMVVA